VDRQRGRGRGPSSAQAASSGGAALGQLGRQAKPGGVPAIGVARGELQHARLGRRDQDLGRRQGAGRAGAARSWVRLVFAAEIHLALAQQRAMIWSASSKRSTL